MENLPYPQGRISRKEAYQLEYEALGKERIFQDKKGSWRIHHVGRAQVNQFYSYIDFKPNQNAGLRIDSFGESGHVHFAGDYGLNDFKRRIKLRIGYTPSKAVLEELWAYAERLREAHREEDSYYAAQDKGVAVQQHQELHERALERFKHGQEIPNPYQGRFSHRRNVLEKYLTKEEREQVNDAQKVINGHAFMNDYHLKKFTDRLGDEIDIARKQMEQEREQKQRKELMNRLEIDPVFRLLVAHALQASVEKKAGSVDYELAHRYFGYTDNLTDFRVVNSKYHNLMKSYGLKTFHGRYLTDLGKEYLKNEGYLPAATPIHERQYGRIYFGDLVTDGGKIRKVDRVGRKYVYMDGGVRWEKAKIRHVA